MSNKPKTKQVKDALSKEARGDAYGMAEQDKPSQQTPDKEAVNIIKGTEHPEEFQQTPDEGLLPTPEEIVVKVWDMALASVSPDADPKGYQIVRTATLEWARDEIKAKAKPILKAEGAKEERERISEMLDKMALDYVSHQWWSQWLLFKEAVWQALKGGK